MTVGTVLRRRGSADPHRFSHPMVWQALQEADVLCMQEVWLTDATKLFDALGHGHKVRDDGGWRLRPFSAGGSGLGMAAAVPVVSQELRAFHTPPVGTDRFARKGMLCARLRLSTDPVRELDIVTTHLQASQGASAQVVREQQLRELRRAVDELGAPTRAFLLCGDLNIDGLRGSRNGEYERLTRVFPDFVDLGAHADQPTMCPVPRINDLAFRFWGNEPLQRLDYMLFRPPVDDAIVAHGCEVVLDQPLPAYGGQATFASDHFGLRARLHLNGHGAGGAAALAGAPGPFVIPATEASLGGGDTDGGWLRPPPGKREGS